MPHCLPGACSLIIYRGDKIKQTQQNGAKPKRRGSHSHALIRREELQLGLFYSMFLPPSIPQRVAVRWKPSIRTTPCVRMLQ